MKKALGAALLLPALSFALEFSDADIVLPAGASKYHTFAAQELSKHLRMITGGEFRITSAPRSRVRIMVGTLPPSVDRKLLTGRDSFAVAVQGNTVSIAGLDTCGLSDTNPYALIKDLNSKGTLAGVHTFLEEQGIRWLAPGEQNTSAVRKKSIKLPEGCRIVNPVMDSRCIAELYFFGQAFRKIDGKEYERGICEGQLWAVRLRSNYGSNAIAHTECVLRLGEIWKDHPERFQLTKEGKRNTRYLCWTDPAVADMWEKAADAFFAGLPPAAAGLPHLKSWKGLFLPGTFCIDPMDHGSSNDGRCYCDRCDEFRKKVSCADDTEIIWRVIARTAWKVKAKYPGKFVATLVYPPKQGIPRTVKLPDNLQLCICLAGPSAIFSPKRLAQDMKLLKQWSALVGREKICLWTYQCEGHGGKLPGVPETYPDCFAAYLPMVLPYARGMYHEYHAWSLTCKLLETYIQTKLMWDPGADWEKIRREHIGLYYGPAAGAMEKLFSRLESNWKLYEKQITSVPSLAADLGTSRNGPILRKIAWSKVYTKEEMARLAALLTEGEKVSDGIFRERVKRFRKYVYDIMVRERSEVMELADKAPEIRLTPAPWEKQPRFELISAHRDGTKLTARTWCRFRLDKGEIQVLVEAEEPRMVDVKISPKLRNGSPDIWKDWTLEFFFHLPAENTMKQYIVSAGNRISRHTVTPRSTDWSDGREARYTLTPRGSGYQLEFAVPLSALGKDVKELKLNVVRERHIKKAPPEYSTFSPASLLGNWLNPDSFARVFLP